MLSPAFVLGAVLSTAYAAIFHLWNKGGMSALLRYLLASWLGFACGHFLGEMAGIQWLEIGHLGVLNGSIGALAALFTAKSLET